MNERFKSLFLIGALLLAGCGEKKESSTTPEDTSSICTDADGDGFGVGDSCAGTDCNDEDKTRHQELIVFVDSDGDSFGDPTKALILCAGDTVPDTHVPEGGDCDDTQAEIHPNATEICDPNNVDENCNELSDNDDDASGKTTYFTDADGDGFGTAPGQDYCNPPANVVTKDGDCDDNSASTFPGAAANDSLSECMKDYDEDDYGDKDSTGNVLSGSDCDDASATTFPAAAPNDNLTACMKDSDNDDYGDANAPADVPAGSDCDDTNSALYLELPGYADTDVDTFGAGAEVTLCTDGMLPSTHVTNDDDCDDNSNTTFPGAATNDSPTDCMKDADEDDYGDKSSSANVTPGSDCDDADNTRYLSLDGYINTDGDNYGAEPMVSLCTAGSLPITHVAIAGDCDDTSDKTFPGAAPNDSLTACMKDFDQDDYGDDYAGQTPPAGVTTGQDCDDSDVGIFEWKDAYPDADDDGHGVGTVTTAVCTNGTLDNHSNLAINGTDCDDGNDSIHTTSTVYTDLDGDNYGTGASSTLCAGDSLPSGYGAFDGDCDETSPYSERIYPGIAHRDSGSECMKDTDLDGYGDDSPDAHITPGSDCDDTHFAFYQLVNAFKDSDGDGYSPDMVAQPVCSKDSLEASYKLTTIGHDCNDLDPGHWADCATCADSDGDGYGFGVCDSGAEDCDDSNPLVYPGALEIPDNDLDDDCSNGGDAAGDIQASTTDGYFVSQSQGDDGNSGSKTNPLKTLDKAMALANFTGKTNIYLEQATFDTGPITITMNLFGGYDSNWQRTSESKTTLSSHKVKIPSNKSLHLDQISVVYKETDQTSGAIALHAAGDVVLNRCNVRGTDSPVIQNWGVYAEKNIKIFSSAIHSGDGVFEHNYLTQCVGLQINDNSSAIIKNSTIAAGNCQSVAGYTNKSYGVTDRGITQIRGSSIYGGSGSSTSYGYYKGAGTLVMAGNSIDGGEAIRSTTGVSISTDALLYNNLITSGAIDSASTDPHSQNTLYITQHDDTPIAATLINNTLIGEELTTTGGVPSSNVIYMWAGEIKAINNIFYNEGDNTVHGIIYARTQTAWTLYNNLFWHNNLSSPPGQPGSSSLVAGQDSISGVNNCAATPQCIASADNIHNIPSLDTNNDHRLLSDSPCIDAGKDPSPWFPILLDFEKDTRPTNGVWDIGYDEYVD